MFRCVLYFCARVVRVVVRVSFALNACDAVTIPRIAMISMGWRGGMARWHGVGEGVVSASVENTHIQHNARSSECATAQRPLLCRCRARPRRRRRPLRNDFHICVFVLCVYRIALYRLREPRRVTRMENEYVSTKALSYEEA